MHSVSHGRKAWEVLLDLKVFVDTLMWKTRVLSFVSFHLGNEVDEMLWLLEKFKLLGVDQVTKFIFDLDNKFNNV